MSDGFQQSPMQRTVVAHIDYSRAYDKVRIDALLMKMSQKGIPSHMVRLMHAWQFNRLTWMSFDGAKSRSVTLKQGVQLGSFQSSLLFYTDDLASAIGAPQVSLFADNVAVSTQETDLERATSKLQVVIDAATSWNM